MLGFARKATAERRAQPRRRVNWGSWVAGLDGAHCVKCRTLDVSASGARVAPDEIAGWPEKICFLDMRHKLAYVARIAWRRSPEMGLEFLQVYRFDELPFAALRAVIARVG